MDAPPKHRAISRELAAEIVAGKYRNSGRLPSEAQLVKRFDVSRPTIGRALRDLLDEGLIVRRAGSGTYVSETNERLRNVRPSGPQIGMIIPSLRHTEIFEAICGEISSLARVHDISLWWNSPTAISGESSMTVAEAEELCDRFIAHGVAGVFFVPFEHRADRETANRRIVAKLRQAGIPVVLLDRDLGAFPSRADFDLVGVDNFAGGYQLAEHLIKLGMRRIAFVTKPLTASTVDARIAGAKIAMLNNDLDLPKPFVHAGDPGDLKFVRTLAQGRKYDAVMCTSDHIAALLLQSLNRLGIKVPDDLRVVGFDDVRFASLLTVPLTTNEQPCRDIAVAAFHAMKERLVEPALPARTIMLTPRLVVRESCGAYLAQRRR
ncbi:GntR family transcriptional regulator [Haloferula sp. BvORR071]|uniref:substrate-binding domain-containing protein n=1 Tax=Haloferula sp. BvORR071 TaxID=1396141 RepID=UPI000557D372|nr:GntR family transcriptional regulator [Haloferula sp. BvORR071]